jgi:putative chitinase
MKAWGGGFMVTPAQYRSLYPRAAAPLLAGVTASSDATLKDFGISALPNRLHFFLAQIGHESGGLTITEEKMGYSAARMMTVWPTRFRTLESALPYAGNPEKLGNYVYANRLGNGAPESGDGYRYRGRGLIQITGRDGYKRVGAIAGIDLVGHPERAFAPGDALLVACAFWKWKGLNAICDTGDFRAATRRINGGTIGWTDRLAWLEKVRTCLAEAPPPNRQPPAETVRAVQLALRARGFVSIGSADGLLGPRTAAAIAGFRRINGLAPGMIDDALTGVLLAD